MCTNPDCGLTVANLLADPLIAMVMHSDGVSRDAHAALWQRIEDASAARFWQQAMERDTVAAG
jgi:hypothetical protein